MKNLLQIAFLFFITLSTAQVKLELTPTGFTAIEVAQPNKSFDKILEVSKSWSSIYNKKTNDVFDVTQNSLSISALNEYAYFYWNLGVKYNYDIKYVLTIKLIEDQKYQLTFKVNEILKENVLTKTTTAVFFTSEGTLKAEYEESKTSLESTVNKIVNSYVDFIAR